MEKPIKILSIDGGGIRGIIPATILAYIEQRMGKPICDIFDLIAGTSTGGIIALGLVKPDEDQNDEMGAPDEALELYGMRGEKIFYRPFSKVFRSIRQIIYDERYNATPLERELKSYFADISLADAITPVIVPTYDIENRRTRFFKSRNIDTDGILPMWQVARATSAAPTFFEPFNFIPPYEEPEKVIDFLRYRRGTLVDGAVMANNPTMCAYIEMMKHGRKYVNGFTPNTPIIVVSLGTGDIEVSFNHEQVKDWGQTQWAIKIMSEMFVNGAMDVVDYQMREAMKSRQYNEYRAHQRVHSAYFRFQPKIDRKTKIDDVSSANIEALKQEAQQELVKRHYTIDRMIRMLEADNENE